MPKIIIAINPFVFSDPRRKKYQEVAMEVLSLLPDDFQTIAVLYENETFPLFLPSNIQQYSVLKRNSAIEIGNTRPLPYVKEILDFASTFECDIFGYLNSDILVGADFVKELRCPYDAFILSRQEVAETTVEAFPEGNVKRIWGGDKHGGSDGFFFDQGWWMENRERFHNDLIIGATNWDNYYRDMIMKYCDNYSKSRCLYHVIHTQSWRVDTPDAINNTKIWEKMG